MGILPVRVARTVVSVLGLDRIVQATLRLGETLKPLRGTGILPVRVARTVVSVLGLDRIVQATLRLGKMPKRQEGSLLC
ncbi:MAG: hypothetical protein NZ874_04250 [Fimbriimonadales bacterium]|nr:hypothetical protein [Fimbriimonadales bacterium]